MDAKRESELSHANGRTTVERRSERELVVTRIVNGPARIVFEAFTNPELFMRWWLPKSFGLCVLSFEADVRTGGGYRLRSRHGDSQPMEFYGKYVDVTPPSRLSWTNEEGGDSGPVTTVTFEDEGDRTRVVLHDLYPSKEALDAAIGSGSTSCLEETFDQLAALVVTMEPASAKS